MKSAVSLLAGVLLAAGANAADQVRFDQAYVGTLPCADCAGIRTSIVFSRDRHGALSYRSEETYLGTREGDRSYGSQGSAAELGGTRFNPWAARIRIDPNLPDTRRHFLVLSPTVIELVGANGERANSMLDYTLVLERPGVRSKPALERRLFSGTLRRVLDRLELVPCGGGPVLTAVDVSPESSLSAALSDIGFDRVDGLYLEAFGRLREGTLWLERLNRAGTEMRCPDTKAPVPLWQASGNEPGWLLSDAKGRLSLTRPGLPPLVLHESGLAWRWREGRADQASAQVRAESDSALVSGTLTPRLCRDTMADAVYGFRFDGRLNHERKSLELKGCGWLGSEALPG